MTEAGINNGEKTVSSISGSGKMGELHVKEEGKLIQCFRFKNKIKLKKIKNKKPNILKKKSGDEKMEIRTFIIHKKFDFDGRKVLRK